MFVGTEIPFLIFVSDGTLSFTSVERLKEGTTGRKKWLDGKVFPSEGANFVWMTYCFFLFVPDFGV